MANHPDPIQEMLRQGILYAQKGQKGTARRCFRQVTALDPENETAWLYLAGLADNAHNAREAFNQLKTLNPANPRLPDIRAWIEKTWPDHSAAAPPAEIPAPSTPKHSAPISARAQPGRPAVFNIAAYLGRKLAFGAVVLLSIIYLSHFGLDMARGTAFGPALGRALIKSLAYLNRLIHFDLGFTAAGVITGLPAPVAEVAPALLSRSLGLLAVSLALAAVVGVALGALAAGRRQSGWSLVILLASIIGVSVPSFFAALLLQILLIQWTRHAGVALLPLGGFGWDQHLILPALVLAARPIAQITRITFVTLKDVLEQDFVRVAHGKGLHPMRVMTGHVLQNAAIPVLTTIGLSLRFSLSSLPVVEFFFGWPGLGATLLKAISQQDDNLTVALALSLGAVFILVNLILDGLYRLIDPRLREAPSGQIHRRVNRAMSLRQRAADLREILADNPLSRRLSRKPRAAEPDFLKEFIERRGKTNDLAYTPTGAEAEKRRRLWRGTLGNAPFALGGLIVLALLAVIIWGPLMAPHSPYTTQGLTIVNGQFNVPPFAPDAVHPFGTDVLGRDILSLLLAGAQQTLFLAGLVVLARLLIGFVLGALAGWLSGSWIDRLLMAVSEIIAAFPTLLLAMILILALGIRLGLRPFVIALCFVGWGEVMQFVRGEVMSLKPRLFIESAVSIGLRTPRIIRNHVLPNLISPLISLAALEMGAVLMLLGELGFIGIFIGGGAFAELDVAQPPFHYSDVPEWAALLSNVRTYARSYPWTSLYPALAFFTAILGFNLFGEGMRRLVESVGVGINRLFNRYTLGLAAVVVVAMLWARGNTGAIAFYRQQAMAFDGPKAYSQAEALTAPALEGRALGTPGMAQAAEQIAGQFEALGLQPAGEKSTYFFTRNRSFERLTAIPRLFIDDGGPEPVYRQDFAVFPGRNRNWGHSTAQVHFFTAAELAYSSTYFIQDFLALKDLDYSNSIIMIPSAQNAVYADALARKGVLVVAAEDALLQKSYTLSNAQPGTPIYGSNRQEDEDAPALWISQAIANRILAENKQTVADLRLQADSLIKDQVLTFPTPRVASLTVEGVAVDKVTVQHVIGYWPGQAGMRGESQLDDRMIVVMAQYDSPPPEPGGQIRAGANDNAGGVAVLLEAIRAMREAGYQPYKTFLFVAYTGEGLEGGELVAVPEPEKFLQAKSGFATAYKIEAVVDLRGLGNQDGGDLQISAGGNRRLARLFETSAGLVGAKISTVNETVDFRRVFEEGSAAQSGQNAPQIRLTRQGWEKTARTPQDTLETVSAENLEEAGQTLSLALMVLGREINY